MGHRRFSRRPFLGLLAGLALPARAPTAAAEGVPLGIATRVIPFNRDDPQARRVGRLIWRGGLVMSAGVPEFGGWSDLHVTPDGRAITALSDQAVWFTATVRYDDQGNLSGLGDGRTGKLKQFDGKTIAGRGNNDSEGLAQLPDGSWLVAFERHHRLWRYPTLADTPGAVETPAEFGRQPANGGAKALTATADGVVVMISEELKEHPGTLLGWIGTPRATGRYQWQTFHYVVTDNFEPTGLAVLPDGAFVVLEHSFDATHGIRGRLTRMPRAEVRAGATVTPSELAVTTMPLSIDNFEGVAASTGGRGETLVWVLSDDSFNPLQRNLLLLFELAPP